MLTVRLGKALHAAIRRVARDSGRTQSSIVREALSLHLEDIEDAAMAKKARATGGRTRSIAEVRKTLAVD